LGEALKVKSKAQAALVVWRAAADRGLQGSC